jgi:hypothetical protein
LSTASANIDVGAGEIRIDISGKEERFTFKPKVEKCSQARMVDRKNSNCVQEDEVAPTKPKVKAFHKRYQPKKLKEINKAKGEKNMEIKNTPAKVKDRLGDQRGGVNGSR